MTLGAPINDQQILNPGTVIQFDVDATCVPFVGATAADIQQSLENWTSDFLTINLVADSTNLITAIAYNTYRVTATVNQAIACGQVRGQVISAINGMAAGECPSVIVNNAIYAAQNVQQGATPPGTGTPSTPGCCGSLASFFGMCNGQPACPSASNSTSSAVMWVAIALVAVVGFVTLRNLESEA